MKFQFCKKSNTFFSELPFMWFRVASVSSEEALSLPPGWFNIVLWHRWDFVIWLWWITRGILQSDGRPTTLSLFYTWERPGKCVHRGNTKTHSNTPNKNPMKRKLACIHSPGFCSPVLSELRLGSVGVFGVSSLSDEPAGHGSLHAWNRPDC